MKYFRDMCVAFLVCMFGLSAGTSVADERKLTTIVTSNKNFEETLKHLEWQFGTYSLTVTSAMNYVDIFKGGNIDVQDAAVFEVMRRKWIEEIIKSDAEMAVWLPIRILVFGSSDGSVRILYISPFSAAALSGNKDQRVLELLKTVDEKLGSLIRTAAR